MEAAILQEELWPEVPGVRLWHMVPCEQMTLDWAQRKRKKEVRLYYPDSLLFPGSC